MSGRRFIVVVLAGFAGLLSLGGVAAGAGLLPGGPDAAVPVDGSGPSVSGDEPIALILELRGKPSGVVSDSRAEGQADANAELQEAVAGDAASDGLIDSELFRVGVAYNGVAVMADPDEADALTKLDGVKAVHEFPEHEATNSHSVPYIGGDEAWSAPGGALTGEGITIGIIDSGIDYAHVDFGGPGSGAAYTEANSAAANPPTPSQHNPGFQVSVGGDTLYPSAKVVGGYDFVGSAYNGGTVTTPTPDPNPIDCAAASGGGHGTHVAGTAGGYGIKDNGDTFDGDYSTLDPSAMPIGPGVAPEAELYALKVFGCGGSTSLTLAAVDWAMDPDRDGITADHLDVINLSLGSSFGMPDDPTAEGLSNAAEAGVSVVSSAGNSGNTTSISGSPASSPRTITVANMSTGSHLDGIEVTGADPGSGANGIRDAQLSVNYPWESFDTPVSAPLAWADETGCAALAPGTYSGKIAMLRWTTGECGSLVRTNNAQAAGALAVVVLVDSSTYDLSFGGNATLPFAYVINPVRTDLIAAAGSGGATITFDSSFNGQGYTTAGAGTLNDSSSRGPGVGGAPKPDIAAPGSNIRSAKSGTGDYHVDYSGTSMSAPHVAGAMALLREAKPGWNVEDLKAAAMNTAVPDVEVGAGLAGAGGDYPPQRVGTGVIDVPAALETELVAKASPGSGEVGLGFGQLQVPLGSPFQREETVTIVNHGSTAEVVDANFIPRSAPPGVVFSVPDGDNVAVPAGGSATVTVRISVPDPSVLRNTRDATLATTQTGSNATVFQRLFDVDASGLLSLAPESSAPPLLVPVHANVRPTSAMAADDVRLAPGDTSGEVELSGETIDTGNAASDWEASVSAFELAARSPQTTLPSGIPEYARFADMRSVGVAEEDGFLLFGIGTDAPLPAPVTYGSFEVSIDTDEDGDDEFVVYNRRWTDATPSGIDVFGTGYFNVATDTSFIRPPLISGSNPGTGEFGSRALVIPIPLSTLGLSGGNLDFDYTVRSYANRLDDEIDSVGPLSWDAADPAIDFGTSYYRNDVPGPIAFDYDAAAAEESGTEGILLLHHLNAGADQAEIVDVEVEGPPVVDAGGPYSGNVGTTITLDASGSSDPNDDPLTISWDLDNDGSYETNGASTELTLGPGPATRSVGLTVTDGHSAPLEQDVSIAVASVAPTVKCKVPKLKGETKKAAKRALEAADCTLGEVTKPKRKRTKGEGKPLVAKQSIKPGTELPEDSSVDIKLKRKK